MLHPLGTVPFVTLIGRRFLHASDLHLGSPLARLDGCPMLSPEEIAQLPKQMQGAYENLVDLAIQENVLFVVLSGDVYDNAESQEAQQGNFRRGLERLAERNIPVFIALGNHDPLVQSLNLRRPYPDLVRIFQVDTPEEFTVASEDGLEIRVAGVSFREKRESQNLAAKFNNLPQDPDVIRIGVLHTNVIDSPSAGEHDPYAPCTVSDLRAAPVQYWALGHIHLRSVNQIDSDRWWAYPGNLQGRNFKSAECQPKGALLVPITRSGIGEPEFRACDTVRFSEVVVDVAALKTVPEVQQAIVDSVLAQQADNGDRRLIVRVVLAGRTSLHHQIKSKTDAGSSMLDEIIDSWGPDLADTVIAGIIVQTGVPFDPVAAREGDSLLASSLKRLDDLSDEMIIARGATMIADVHRKHLDLNNANPEVLRRRVEQILLETMIREEV